MKSILIMGRSKIQIIGPNGEIYQPTLKIQRNNDPNKDAEVLYEAMKGWVAVFVTMPSANNCNN
ncbi:Annexin A13 (Annexin XIII) [Schistosoma japonicum]|nr:Annexin A13 (Annexin XIII) [Schistosoma japonicum]